eukprot:CAMPEP_0184677894 /NCGR_PEP_ID=MMETSP0312-20130426/506_1 /TAXON_ID=31354 /ORGANISM="Compsopogon coeruleus, Strain SAG 36.94" /LENGTH=63 /DNA_ID=CAMNT_0027126095 /DNA_START=1178 /DNA_END=1369 /DNA_ORIENTATION=+
MTLNECDLREIENFLGRRLDEHQHIPGPRKHIPPGLRCSRRIDAPRGSIEDPTDRREISTHDM